jgi:hypothetical protein
MERGHNSCINSTSDSKIRASIDHKDVCANVIIEENQVSESKKCENPACSCIPERDRTFAVPTVKEQRGD